MCSGLSRGHVALLEVNRGARRLAGLYQSESGPNPTLNRRRRRFRRGDSIRTFQEGAVPGYHAARAAGPAHLRVGLPDGERHRAALAGCGRTLPNLILGSSLFPGIERNVPRDRKELNLRDTLRLPAKGLCPSAHPVFQQPASSLRDRPFRMSLRRQRPV